MPEGRPRFWDVARQAWLPVAGILIVGSSAAASLYFVGVDVVCWANDSLACRSPPVVGGSMALVPSLIAFQLLVWAWRRAARHAAEEAAIRRTLRTARSDARRST